MIGEKFQFIFVHIPKTAGNALQSILINYSEDAKVIRGQKDGIHRFGIESPYGTSKHSTLSDYLTTLGPDAFWSKRRFACIRNPWERAISFYFSPHKRRTVWDRDEFLKGLDSMESMASYLRLPTDPAGTLPDRNVDFLIRFERLQQDFDQLCDILGIERHHLPMRNQSDVLPYPDYYDDELIQIVGNRFFEDVSLFGYEFENQVEMDK